MFKTHLISAPILGYLDSIQDYLLDADASLERAGAVLSQIHGGKAKALAYYSKTISLAQCNYCVTHQELLTACMVMQRFGSSPYGHKFWLLADHVSLVVAEK